eukprot:jgi/Galph1/3444/GphlegSOOS_G2074.1
MFIGFVSHALCKYNLCAFTVATTRFSRLSSSSKPATTLVRQVHRVPLLNRVVDQVSMEQEQLTGKELQLNWPQVLKKIVPTLDAAKHKGQCGRIAVVGGCFEYTGAPYFSAISSLRAGVDMAHVFCEDSAAIPIKTYSPELIVHPVLKRDLESNTSLLELAESLSSCVTEWLSTLHCVIVGPGLGRSAVTLETAGRIIQRVTERNIPLVIDADGLFLLSKKPDILKHVASPVVLTPNLMEFRRLINAYGMTEDSMSSGDLLKALSKKICPGAIMVRKGATDLIGNDNTVWECIEQGSLRRCGGQGDVLSGMIGAFCAWMQLNMKYSKESSRNEWLLPVYGACAMTRRCACQAFQKKQRSTLTTDIINEICTEFSLVFPF